MENIIRKETAEQKYYFSFYFNWGFYFSAGYSFCKKIYVSLSNEFYEKITSLNAV